MLFLVVIFFDYFLFYVLYNKLFVVLILNLKKSLEVIFVFEEFSGIWMFFVVWVFCERVICI